MKFGKLMKLVFTRNKVIKIILLIIILMGYISSPFINPMLKEVFSDKNEWKIHLFLLGLCLIPGAVLFFIFSFDFKKVIFKIILIIFSIICIILALLIILNFSNVIYIKRWDFNENVVARTGVLTQYLNITG